MELGSIIDFDNINVKPVSVPASSTGVYIPPVITNEPVLTQQTVTINPAKVIPAASTKETNNTFPLIIAGGVAGAILWYINRR